MPYSRIAAEIMVGRFDRRYSQITLLIGLLLILAILVAYVRIINCDFVGFDDRLYVTKNSRVQTGLAAEGLVWAFTTFHAANWHPLTWLSHMLDCQLYGLNPMGHHWTSLLLHIANTLLLFFILQQMTGAIWRSAFVAALFALHPLHVESVAWVAERKDVLSTFFGLLAIIAYCRYVKQQRLFYYLLVFLLLSLGLMAKPMLVTLPLVLLILDVYPLRRFDLKDRSKALHKKLILEKIPFIILALSAAVFALLAKKGSMLQVAQHGFVDRLMQATYGFCFYLWKTVLPVNLSPLYLLDKAFNPLTPKYILCALSVLGITAGLIAMSRRWPWALSSWVCYGVIVFPLLGFVQSGPQIAADRYTYIACMPFGILVGAGVLRLWAAWYKGELSATVWFIAKQAIWAGLLILAVLSFCQTRIWHDNRMFWNYVLEIDPANYIAYNNRGVFLKEQVGDLALALADFTTAVELNQEFVNAYYNRGLILEHQGDIAGAVNDYTRVIQLDPDNENAYNNRGGLFKKQGNLSGALADFNTAIRLNPSSPEGYANRGVLWQAQNDLKRALQDLNKALEVADADWVYRAEVEKILGNLQAKLIEDAPSAGLH